MTHGDLPQGRAPSGAAAAPAPSTSQGSVSEVWRDANDPLLQVRTLGSVQALQVGYLADDGSLH